MSVFSGGYSSGDFSIFAQVAARLLHFRSGPSVPHPSRRFESLGPGCCVVGQWKVRRNERLYSPSIGPIEGASILELLVWVCRVPPIAQCGPGREDAIVVRLPRDEAQDPYCLVPGWLLQDRTICSRESLL